MANSLKFSIALEENPFPKNDPRHDEWVPFSREVESLSSVMEIQARISEQVHHVLQAVRNAPPKRQEEMWKNTLPQLRRLEPNRSWSQRAPNTDELDYLLAPTVNPGTKAVLAQLDTLTEKALDKFFRGSEDVGRWKQILQYLGQSALAALGNGATDPIRVGLSEKMERWEQAATASARLWNIRTRGDRAQSESRAKDYVRFARHVMGARGIQFDHPFQAADALLESLHEYLIQIKSPHARNGGIGALCSVTAEYCSDLRTRALQDGHTVESDVLGDMARRFRDLVGPSATTDPKGDLYAYRRGDTDVGATAQETGGPNQASVTGSREERLQEFIRLHLGTLYADVYYSARVHKSDFQKWRRNKLKDTSVMTLRIERVLAGGVTLKRKPRKRRAE
jgi:hypothetical protein